MILKYTRTYTTVGDPGAAAASGMLINSRKGFLRAVSIDYAGQPSTVDVVLKDTNSSGAALMTVTSDNTDIPMTPIAGEGMDQTGSATSGAYLAPWFSHGIYVAIAQGDEGDGKTVTVTAVIEV